MSKPEWGRKHQCQDCDTKYYDLQKEIPTCPSCGAIFDPESLLKSRKVKSKDDAVVRKKPIIITAEPDDVDEVVDVIDSDTAIVADDEEDIIEDASDLGGDDADVLDLEPTEEE